MSKLVKTELKEEILTALISAPARGYTIGELASKCSLSRSTISKYCATLEATGEIEIEIVGRLTLIRRRGVING